MNDLAARAANLRLDALAFERLCFYNDDDEVRLPGVTEFAEVYEAAKAVFAQFPGADIWYDREGAEDVLGSPWAQQVRSPEEYVMVFAATTLEDEEAFIYGPVDEDDWDEPEMKPDKIANAIELIKELIAAGVPDSSIRDHYELLTYGVIPLRKALATYVGAQRALELV